MIKPATAEIEKRLQLRFADSSLLLTALTHRSAGSDNYERLEFLGDGVLNAVIGHALYLRRPQASEGDLSRLRASLVRESTLAALGRELNLQEYILVGAGEAGSHRRESVLADVIESITGALYLDAGFAAAQEFLLRLFASRLDELPDAETLKDAKTRLQEYLQARERPLPEYAVQKTSGPAHKRCFEVACRLSDAQLITHAQGSSRRRAEQAAAQAMLDTLTHVS